MSLLDLLQSGSVAPGILDIYLIANGRQMVDGGGFFGVVPRVLWGKVFAPDSDNRIPMATKSLLIVSHGSQGRQYLLVDTGNGTRWNARRKVILGIEDPPPELVTAAIQASHPTDYELEANLSRLNLTCDDITLLVNSHLHGDHAGGNTRWTVMGDETTPVIPSFPNATYIACEREWQDYLHPNERTRATYLPDNMAPIRERDQLKLVPEGAYEVAPGVHCVPTPGHTPGHWSILLRAETIRIGAVGRVGALFGQATGATSLIPPVELPHTAPGPLEAFFAADAAMYTTHLERLAWVPAFDILPMISIETKRVFQHWGITHKPLFIFDHDPVSAAGYLTQANDRCSIVPAL